VEGQGTSRAVPDQAEIEFEVREEGPRLENVSAQVRDKMKNVFQTVKSFGISEKDFQTVSYNIQPKYKYDRGGNETKRVGYIVSNRIRVVLKDLDSAGKLLEAVTQAEVSEVTGPNFGFSDPKKLQIKALEAAVADARAKAEALAEAAGAELGRVFSINQTSTSMPVAPLAMQGNMMGVSSEVPIAKGQNEITTHVEVVYLLK